MSLKHFPKRSLEPITTISQCLLEIQLDLKPYLPGYFVKTEKKHEQKTLDDL